MSVVQPTEAQMLAAQLLKRFDEEAGRTPSPLVVEGAAAGEAASVTLRPSSTNAVRAGKASRGWRRWWPRKRAQRP